MLTARTSANPLATLAEVVSQLGTEGPEGDLDRSAMVDGVDVELAINELSGGIRTECAIFDLLHPNCRLPGNNACVRRLCRMLEDAVCTFAQRVAENNVEVSAAREANTEPLESIEQTYITAKKIAGDAYRDCIELAAGVGGSPIAITAVVAIVASFTGPPGWVVGGAAGLAISVIGAGASAADCLATFNTAIASADQAMGDATAAANAPYNAIKAAVEARQEVQLEAYTAAVAKANFCYDCCDRPNNVGGVEPHPQCATCPPL